MGLGNGALDLILREHSYKPIRGDVLFVGRQTLYFTPEELCWRIRSHGLSPDASAIEIDNSTIDRLAAFAGRKLATDRSIFFALGNRRVKALDVSPYEGAEIVHDLNLTVPNHLKGIADFLVDGSTLDNVFDATRTLRNFADLLRPGGRLLMINSYTTRDTAYVIMPPLWYYDFFVENGWADVKLYVAVYESQRSSIYAVDPDIYAERRREMGHFGSGCFMDTVVFAEKGEQSTSDRTPIQQHYRQPDQWEPFLANLAPIQRSKRPHLLASPTNDAIVRDYPDGYHWIGPNYQPQDPPSAEQPVGLSI
jgi:hypothetical protein